MREHQIVVNLKAQQFEQLQRLAREHGYKSVSAFVKQKVLDLAMGIESAAPYNGDNELALTAASPINDLDRIHSELRAFLDELSGPTELLSTSFSSPLSTSLNAPLAATSASGSGAGQYSDSRELRDLQDQYAVAAPDDDFDWAPSGGSGYSTAAYSPGLIPGVTPGMSGDISQNYAEPESASPYQDEPESDTLPQVLPSNNLGGFGYGLGRYSSYTAGGGSARFASPFSAGDRLSGYRDIMDDMEELADRAFAISPRLGALDENVQDEDSADDPGRSGRRKSQDTDVRSGSTLQAESAGSNSGLDYELDEQGAEELEASAYADSDDSYDYADSDDLKLDLNLDLNLGPEQAPITSFVEPIAPDKLLTPEQIEAEELAQTQAEARQKADAKLAKADAKMRNDLSEIVTTTDFSPGEELALDPQSKALLPGALTDGAAGSEADSQPAAAAEAVVEKPRRRSSKLFDQPMLPPPDEDEPVAKTPTFVPPPAPLPPRVSQTNLASMTPEEAMALQQAAALSAAAAAEDDLLSELLDGNVTATHSQRDQSAPNPFAVSLSFELEATAAATNDVESPVGALANQLASLEEQTPLGQIAMSAEEALEDNIDTYNDDQSPPHGANVSGAQGSGGEEDQANQVKPHAVPSSSDSDEQSLNPSTFSGSPPPKRRRT